MLEIEIYEEQVFVDADAYQTKYCMSFHGRLVSDSDDNVMYFPTPACAMQFLLEYVYGVKVVIA